MHVLLDVHVANNDQQSAVACNIASSHEDLHEKTSISSLADPNSHKIVPNTVSPRTDLCLEFRTTTKIHSIQKIIPTIVDCWASNGCTLQCSIRTDPSQPSDQFWHSSRSSSRMFHSSRCSEANYSFITLF